MSEPQSLRLKIGPIPDMTPVRMTVAMDPDLKSDLEAYASLYEQSYGEKVGSATLVPVMLRSFLSSDAGFRRARKAMAE